MSGIGSHDWLSKVETRKSLIGFHRTHTYTPYIVTEIYTIKSLSVS